MLERSVVCSSCYFRPYFHAHPQDLSTISFPVTFNEPLTLLQRTAEEVEYHDLLRQAATTTDPLERLSYIAAFAVSGYAHTRFRTGRKGLWAAVFFVCVFLLTVNS